MPKNRLLSDVGERVGGGGRLEMQLNLYVYVLKCSRDEACSRQMMDTGLVLMYGAAYDAGQKREIVVVVGVGSLTVVVGAGDF